VVHVVNIINTNSMLSVISTDVQLNWDMSISLPGKIETENKQSVGYCLLDRVATVDSRLVSLFSELLATYSALKFDTISFVCVCTGMAILERNRLNVLFVADAPNCYTTR